MTGQPYDGGGIGVTVAATRAATDDELTRLLAGRVAEMRAQGTTTVEIKSGYGLTVADELRALQIASQFTAETTFLGAHVVPAEYGRRPAADMSILSPGRCCRPRPRTRAGSTSSASPTHRTPSTPTRPGASSRPDRAAGLGLRVHGNQLGPGPGVQLAVELGAASVDHCTYLSDADVDALADAAETRLPRCCRGWSSAPARPIPTRPAARGRVSDRAGHRLQSRDLLLVLDAVGDRPRGPGDGAYTGPSPVRRHGRVRAVPAAYRYRPDRGRQPRRPRRARRALVPASGLSPWRADYSGSG